MDWTLWPAAGEADRTADGFLTGVAVGEVTDNRDPENLARVRVRLPWHPEGGASYWARPAVPMAGNGRGTYFLPEVGDEVLVAAENGDPSHLYVLGSLWNGGQPPPVRNDDGKNDARVLHSRSGHTVRFHDDEARPEVEIALADGKKVLLDRDGITVDDANGNVIALKSSSGALEITAGRRLTLKAADITIEATTGLTVKSSGTLTVKGSLVQIN